MEGQISFSGTGQLRIPVCRRGKRRAFAISGLTYFLGEEKYRDISRIGAYIAPFPLLVGLMFLIYDLERPQLFWKLLVTLQPIRSCPSGPGSSWSFPCSASSISTSGFRTLRRGGTAPKRSREMDHLPIVRTLRTSPLLERLQRKNLNGFRGWIGIAGIPVALLVGIYTGVLLGACSRPFWNNPMLRCSSWSRP